MMLMTGSLPSRPVVTFQIIDTFSAARAVVAPMPSMTVLATALRP